MNTTAAAKIKEDVECQMRTHNVNEIIEVFDKCMVDCIPVFVTDGTVTRKVICVEKDINGLYFSIYAESTGWISLIMSCATYLDSYSAALYQDGYIIAPDWWHDIGTIGNGKIMNESKSLL